MICPRYRSSRISSCSCRVTWRGQSSCPARSLRICITSGSWAEVTTIQPGLMIPALTAAISPGVSPRIPVWSLLIGVKTATSVFSTMFVASVSPPRPHSNTTRSQSCSLKYKKAIAVSISNTVGLFSPADSIRAIASRTRAVSLANASSDIHIPSI